MDNEKNIHIKVRKAMAAMEMAMHDVILRARRCNSKIVVWRDGKVVELDPFLPVFDEQLTKKIEII